MADARRRHKGGSPFGAGAAKPVRGAPRSLSAGPLSCPRDEGSESRPVAANLREVGKTRALAHSELPPSHYRRTRNEGSESRLVVTRSNPKTISAYLFPQRRFGVEGRCRNLPRMGKQRPVVAFLLVATNPAAEPSLLLEEAVVFRITICPRRTCFEADYAGRERHRARRELSDVRQFRGQLCGPQTRGSFPKRC